MYVEHRVYIHCVKYYTIQNIHSHIHIFREIPQKTCFHEIRPLFYAALIFKAEKIPNLTLIWVWGVILPPDDFPLITQKRQKL